MAKPKPLGFLDGHHNTDYIWIAYSNGGFVF